MSFGAGYGNRPGQAGGPFSPEEEDEAEQTFEFRRLTPNELGTWPPPGRPPAAAPPPGRPPAAPPPPGRPPAAPPPPGRPPAAPPPPARPRVDVSRHLPRGPASRRIWLLAAGVAIVAAAGTVVGLLWVPGFGPARRDGSTARHTDALARHTAQP